MAECPGMGAPDVVKEYHITMHTCPFKDKAYKYPCTSKELGDFTYMVTQLQAALTRAGVQATSFNGHSFGIGAATKLP